MGDYSEAKKVKLKKTFECSLCDSTFYHKRDMQVHVEFVHEKVKTKQCPNCHVSYARIGDLNRHIASVHKEKMPFQCDFVKKNLH